MSSNCGAPPAKASIAANVAIDQRRGGLARAAAQHLEQALLAELLVVGVLRLGDAVREEHERVAAARARACSRRRRAAGREEPERHAGRDERHGLAGRAQHEVVEVAGADERRRRRWPARARRARRSRTSPAAWMRRAARWRARRARRASRSGRAGPAGSPACCSSRAPRAVPCRTRRPRRAADALARRRRRQPAAHRSSRRRSGGPAGCARRTRSRPRAAARRGTDPPGCAPPASSSPSSFARASSACLVQGHAAARARSAAWIVRSNSRAFSIAVAVCSASVVSSFSSAAVYGIGSVLPSASTPIVRSPTFSGAQIRPRMRRVVLRAARGRATRR